MEENRCRNYKKLIKSIPRRLKVVVDTKREAGGSFGKMEVAREEEYFRRLITLGITDLEGKFPKRFQSLIFLAVHMARDLGSLFQERGHTPIPAVWWELMHIKSVELKGPLSGCGSSERGVLAQVSSSSLD
ncbi:hypothetical protein TNCV_1778561 [Trichonephila clavipes]|nr:hypothetical protein TNCV_1778561 [Trichonephila clavipes]